jgi:hypothetical protein
MSYINLLTDIEICIPTMGGCGTGSGLDGEFKMEAFKGFEFPRGSGKVFEYPGTRRLLMDWGGNLVVNQGLDFYGNGVGNALAQCHVGTGNATPTNADTQLQTFVAAAQSNWSDETAEGSAPYFGLEENHYLFQPNFGPGAVNLNEIAVGETATPTSITARALTVNGSGTPTTVSVLADEYLECYYKRRNYPGHITEATGAPTDDTDTVTVQGVPYTYTIRPAMVTAGGTHSVGTGQGWGTGLRYINQPALGFNNNIFSSALAGTDAAVLGAVTSTLSAFQSTGGASSYGASAYSGGSYAREMYWVWGISAANEGTGIKGLFLKTRMGAYQMTFDSVIPKVYGEVLTFYHNFSWTRKTTWV